VRLCRQLGLFEQALVAIDGSKFKAVNNRDRNYRPHVFAYDRTVLNQARIR
jgi:transposase